jgi:ribonucleoside-diphosphate reductase beta chain
VHACPVSPVLVGYEHFLGIADRAAWDQEDIDLGRDAARWPQLGAEARERITAFVAGFALAEECVAVDLGPFIDAASDPALADCFRAQARDEERHARFFDRYTRSVIRAGDLRAHVPPGFRELFEGRLRAAARDLASGRLGLPDSVALYHLILEGVVFSAGQTTLLDELQRSGELAGLRQGLERIVADERWHIGLGVRVLSDCGTGVKVIDAAGAIGAWGSLLPAGKRAAALRLHRRRLAAAGLAGQGATSPSSPFATATS